MKIDWFRPKKKKASYYDMVYMYVCAYVYSEAEYDTFDGCMIPLTLPSLRDIEYLTGINRQYVLDALNQMIEEDLIRKEGTHSRNTKYVVFDWFENTAIEKLTDFKNVYPELFYNESENPLSRKRYSMLSDDDKKLFQSYCILPNFKAWKKKTTITLSITRE